MERRRMASGRMVQFRRKKGRIEEAAAASVEFDSAIEHEEPAE